MADGKKRCCVLLILMTQHTYQLGSVHRIFYCTSVRRWLRQKRATVASFRQAKVVDVPVIRVNISQQQKWTSNKSACTAAESIKIRKLNEANRKALHAARIVDVWLLNLSLQSVLISPTIVVIYVLLAKLALVAPESFT